jgi:hypothetical protein
VLAADVFQNASHDRAPGQFTLVWTIIA